MRNIINIAIVIIVSISFTSCFDKKSPNYRYMPNMYQAVSTETNGEYEVLPYEQANLLPAEGTIPRGWKPYGYANTFDAKKIATTELKNTMEITDKNLKQGKKLFDIYCAVCHGEKGDGNGILVQREKFMGIPSFADKGRKITEGNVYHTIMYGLNSMGSHASQTSEKDRWQIVMHVMDLKSTLKGEPLWSTVTKDSIIASRKMMHNNNSVEVVTSPESH